ncbi:hypothetical protein BT63DRAFT_85878 [Microthyrium microscopicum]|uniref:Yeast cell wall synthesis Kre9/Knh1-like N-terminal domain-containing protein n=1 Tax=Microthyrium microscopicum TaxID=703497 RepID=A0A6A6TZL8_9PEZI|nr:hypothetical protein BT63DRAFT_85878 [Microthyrium microscopicum]
MRFFTLAISAVSLLAGYVAAENNPIIFPGQGAAIQAGTAVEIKWTPTTTGPVTLTLRFGSSANLATGAPIAGSVPNSGTFTWNVPSDIGSGTWSIAITGGSDTNYSPFFTVTGGTGTQGAYGKTSTTTTVSSTSTTSSGTTTSKSSSASTTDASSTSSKSSTGTASPASTTSSKSSSVPSSGASLQMGGNVAAAIGLGAFAILV